MITSDQTLLLKLSQKHAFLRRTRTIEDTYPRVFLFFFRFFVVFLSKKKEKKKWKKKNEEETLTHQANRYHCSTPCFPTP